MDNIVAYEKFEWEKILQLIDKMSFAKKEYMANFDKKWCPHFTLCVNYHCKNLTNLPNNLIKWCD